MVYLHGPVSSPCCMGWLKLQCKLKKHCPHRILCIPWCCVWPPRKACKQILICTSLMEKCSSPVPDWTICCVPPAKISWSCGLQVAAGQKAYTVEWNEPGCGQTCQEQEGLWSLEFFDINIHLIQYFSVPGHSTHCKRSAVHWQKSCDSLQKSPWRLCSFVSGARMWQRRPS